MQRLVDHDAAGHVEKRSARPGRGVQRRELVVAGSTARNKCGRISSPCSLTSSSRLPNSTLLLPPSLAQARGLRAAVHGGHLSAQLNAPGQQCIDRRPRPRRLWEDRTCPSETAGYRCASTLRRADWGPAATRIEPRPARAARAASGLVARLQESVERSRWKPTLLVVLVIDDRSCQFASRENDNEERRHGTGIGDSLASRRCRISPTEPSICSSISRFISTAYSIGSSLISGSMKPLTIIVLASASDSPRLVR